MPTPKTGESLQARFEYMADLLPEGVNWGDMVMPGMLNDILLADRSRRGDVPEGFDQFRAALRAYRAANPSRYLNAEQVAADDSDFAAALRKHWPGAPQPPTPTKPADADPDPYLQT